jgi:hypothetical protein
MEAVAEGMERLLEDLSPGCVICMSPQQLLDWRQRIRAVAALRAELEAIAQEMEDGPVDYIYPPDYAARIRAVAEKL